VELSVSNSSSGRHWELDQVPAVRDPTHIVQLGAGDRGSLPRTPRPAAALKVFQDVDAFFRRYLHTKPKPIDPKLVHQEPA
jgi:hypothetical protein